MTTSTPSASHEPNTVEALPGEPYRRVGKPDGIKFVGLARHIRARTNDGADLVTILLSMARGKHGARPAQRLQAITALLEYGGFAKATQRVDLGGGLNGDGELTITIKRVTTTAEGQQAIDAAYQVGDATPQAQEDTEDGQAGVSAVESGATVSLHRQTEVGDGPQAPDPPAPRVGMGGYTREAAGVGD